MAWDVEFTDDFGQWWDGLTVDEQESVDFSVGLLIEYGPTLKFPHSSRIVGSSFGQMRELRVQHEGRPYRVLYAFDPKRAAVLIIGGDKTGQDRFYDIMIPMADRIFADYLAEQKLQDSEKEKR